MKKNVKYRSIAVSLFLVFAVLVATILGYILLYERVLASGGQGAPTESAPQNYLLLGVDAAAENTDVILLCSVESTGVSLLQIPRDTYVSCEEGEGKINKFYKKFLGRTKNKEQAAQETAQLFSRLFGVPIHGYAVVDSNTVEMGVDLVGGIPVSLSRGLRYTDARGERHTLPPGTHRLDGAAAMAYLRYREGYATGDLGRLEAQIPFFHGVLSVLREPRGVQEYLTIYQKIMPNLLTNLREKDIIKFMVSYLREQSLPTVRVMRLAGEPTVDERGVSYYVLRRATAERMLAEHFAGEGLDAPSAFTRADSDAFMNIFTVPNSEYLCYLLEQGQDPRAVRQ